MIDGTGSEKKKWIDRTSTLFVAMGLFVALLLFAIIQATDFSAETQANTRPAKAKQIIERRTSAGVGIEKGADLDYRLDGDKIIDLSVSMIRRKGYRCNTLSTIRLYRHPERIVVECNASKDKYWVQRDSEGLFRQVTRY